MLLRFVFRKRSLASLTEKQKSKLLEIYDSPDELLVKIEQLAALITKAKSCLVYTGAGMSTAANIPDYRGKNGVWTSLGRVTYVTYLK